MRSRASHLKPMLRCLACCTLILAGGCGVDAADTPFAGTYAFTDPSGGYQLHVQSPPWEVASAEPGDVQMDVPGRVFSVSIGSPATYTLEITPAAGLSADLAAADAASLSQMGDTVVYADRTVVTAAGNTGTEVVAVDGTSGTYVRDDYVDGGNGTAYHLAYRSIYDLTWQTAVDLDVMVASFAAPPPPSR